VKLNRPCTKIWMEGWREVIQREYYECKPWCPVPERATVELNRSGQFPFGVASITWYKFMWSEPTSTIQFIQAPISGPDCLLLPLPNCDQQKRRVWCWHWSWSEMQKLACPNLQIVHSNPLEIVLVHNNIGILCWAGQLYILIDRDDIMITIC